jgi:YegS/Rv2252/BmrU family lipid kinase
MPKYRVILNPVAGKGNGSRMLLVIEQKLKELKFDFDLVQTEGVDHAIGLTRQAVRDGVQVVIAAGGDGTSNEVLNGLMEARKAGEGNATMAVLPVGRGNDFAFGMAIPAVLEDAFKVLEKGNTRAIDVGVVHGELYPQGRYFGNGVGVGFDAVVGFVAAKMKISGIMSYLVAAIKTIFIYYKAPTVKIIHDGENLIQPVLLVSIMNGTRMGGSFMMAPDGNPLDSFFNLCIAREVKRSQILGLIGRVMKGNQAEHPAFTILKGKQISITAEKGTLPAHADGVTLCESGNHLDIELLPKALEIITDGLPQ